MNARKAMTTCLMFFLLGSMVAATAWQGQEKGKEKEEKKGLGGIFKSNKKADDAQKDKSGEGQKSENLVFGKDLLAGVDDDLKRKINNEDQTGPREYPTLYTRADVEQHKQKLQPTATELDGLRREHEELLKKLGVPDLTPEEKANIEDKERKWRDLDTRLNEVYNDSIFLSTLASQPSESAFRSVANQLVTAFQNPRVGASVAAMQTGAAMQSGAATQPGATYLTGANRAAGPSYLNLTRLPVTNVLPAQIKRAGELSELQEAAPAVAAKKEEVKPEKALTEENKAGKDVPTTAKNKQPPPSGSGSKPVNKPKAGTQVAKNQPKSDAKAETAAESPQTAATRGQKPKAAENNAAQGSQTAAAATTAMPPPAPPAPTAPAAATIAPPPAPPAPTAPAAATIAPPPAPPATTTAATEVKSPQVKFDDDPAPKPAATTGAVTTAKKPADEKSGKPSKFGGFMKDMGKATGKVAHQTIDPQGAERKELNAAGRRSFSRIDREDDFLLGVRLKYNELFAKAKQTRASAEKDQLRKEIADLSKKEEEIADVYRRIKAKHDLLDRQQNAINLAEDSIHFTSGKYAGGMKNILVTRANYVNVMKWPIPKGQWPELYFNRFACAPGEDCKAAYEKLSKENFEAVEKTEQAKDKELKSDEPVKALNPPRAREELRKPNKCERAPFAFEKSDGACWVAQEVEGRRIYRSRFPIWEGHRSMETLKDGIATLIVYSAFESLANGRPTLSMSGLLALTGSALETMLMPRQLTEISDVYYKVIVDDSYSTKRLDFIRENLERSLPNNAKVYFAGLKEYAEGGSTWFTPNGPTKEMKDFIKRHEQEKNVKFDAVLEWDSVPNSEATRVRIYSLAAAEQAKGTPLAFEFLYPGLPVEKKSAAKGQPPELNHFRWFGQEPIPAYKPEGSFKVMSARQAGDMVLDRKEVFLYALNYFAKDMAELHK